MFIPNALTVMTLLMLAGVVRGETSSSPSRPPYPASLMTPVSVGGDDATAILGPWRCVMPWSATMASRLTFDGTDVLVWRGHDSATAANRWRCILRGSWMVLVTGNSTLMCRYQCTGDTLTLDLAVAGGHLPLVYHRIGATPGSLLSCNG